MGDEIHNKVRVSICGTMYTIRGRASEEHLHTVAGMVHELMQQVAAANPSLDTRRVAVLSALNMADELHQLRIKYDELLSLLEVRTENTAKPS